jgi:hypothetical protein
MSIVKDLIGQRFGSLIVFEQTASLRPKARWLCRCDCGKVISVDGYKLTTGRKTSCGCESLNNNGQPRKQTEHHGGSNNSRLYRIYRQMRVRCGYADGAEDRVKRDYELRGIKICDEWKDSFLAFQEWALSHGYRDNLSIDRINNDGNYEPSNCRWATSREQVRNTRRYLALHYQ